MKFNVISYSKILFLLSLLIFVYNLFKNKNTISELFKTKLIKGITLGFGIFMFFVAISTIINSFFNKLLIFSDFFEIARVLQYYLIFINYYLLFYKNNNTKFFNNIILVILLILGIIGVSQYFNLGGLNEHYVKIIAKEG